MGKTVQAPDQAEVAVVAVVAVAAVAVAGAVAVAAVAASPAGQGSTSAYQPSRLDHSLVAIVAAAAVAAAAAYPYCSTVQHGVGVASDGTADTEVHKPTRVFRSDSDGAAPWTESVDGPYIPTIVDNASKAQARVYRAQERDY